MRLARARFAAMATTATPSPDSLWMAGAPVAGLSDPDSPVALRWMNESFPMFPSPKR